MQPGRDCPLCPRLVAFRVENRERHPNFSNSPVLSSGSSQARLLLVGEAPGLKGANRTGKPFMGDSAGQTLHYALLKHGLAKWEYDTEIAESRVGGTHTQPGTGEIELLNCRVTNAVRCVPPPNPKATPDLAEITKCNGFLVAEIKEMLSLSVILTIGEIAHKAVIMALGLRRPAYKWKHGAEHRLQLAGRELHLLNSYHCGCRNFNNGKLTEAMFDAVVKRAKELVGEN